MKRLDSQWLNKKTEYSSVAPLRVENNQGGGFIYLKAAFVNV